MNRVEEISHLLITQEIGTHLNVTYYDFPEELCSAILIKKPNGKWKNIKTNIVVESSWICQTLANDEVIAWALT